jgi:hypothetical protein
MHKLFLQQNNVEEYSSLCNNVELEINSLLSPGLPEKNPRSNKTSSIPDVNIDEINSFLNRLEEEQRMELSLSSNRDGEFEVSEVMREDFWREMEQSDDNFETISWFLSKGFLIDM